MEYYRNRKFNGGIYMRRGNIFWGITLIFIGGITLAGRFYDFDFISWSRMWPLFVLIPGLAFELGYFTTRRDAGLLVPGGILTTIGLLFVFETLTGWSFSWLTWPIYPLAVAIGLFQLYIFGGKERGLLIPVFILGGFSIVSLSNMIVRRMFSFNISGLFFPAALIVLGVYLLVKHK
jgi:hypothetical protein